MPTQTDFQELLSGTTNEWILNYNGTGVNGRKFTSKTNGNSIFIAAADGCSNGSVNDVGYLGCVWSSSLYTSVHYNAWDLGFSSFSYSMYGNIRCYGLSVRGVRK